MTIFWSISDRVAVSSRNLSPGLNASRGRRPDQRNFRWFGRVPVTSMRPRRSRGEFPGYCIVTRKLTVATPPGFSVTALTVTMFAANTP